MNTSPRLQSDVRAELAWDPAVQDWEIGVIASDGVVTLTGFVPTYADRIAAAHAAARVTGVRAVVNQLDVDVIPARLRTDDELARAAANALGWDVHVPRERVTATAKDGWITLDGRVERGYERDAAALAVQNLVGVRGVTNNVVVVPERVTVFDVSLDIRKALERQADCIARQIHIEAVDGIVTLRGSVPTLADRVLVENAAWSATGVTTVLDELTVEM